MIQTLYSPFRKWTEKGTLWIYSDPHFSDPDMVELRTNYIGDEEQIARINSKVGKHDTIIFLGDIGNEEMVRKIRGYKVLIMGNHDKGASKYTEIFNEVYEGPLFIAEKLILSHEPIDLPYAVNIHGHEHCYIFKDHHMNVCAEHIDYYPINLTKEIKRGLLSKVDSIHRITIDHATARKRFKKIMDEIESRCVYYDICCGAPDKCISCSARRTNETKQHQMTIDRAMERKSKINERDALIDKWRTILTGCDHHSEYEYLEIKDLNVCCTCKHLHDNETELRFECHNLTRGNNCYECKYE